MLNRYHAGAQASGGVVDIAMSLGTTLSRWTSNPRNASAPDAHSRLPEVIAAALALLIFLIDTFAPLHIAVAVIYVVVVLLSASFCGPRGILMWGAVCVGLTAISFLFTHVSDVSQDVAGRTLMSILAIGTTTFLALRIRFASDALQRSEDHLADAQRLSRTGSFALDFAKGEYTWSDETYRIFEYDRALTPTVELVRARIHPEDIEAWTASYERRKKSPINVDIQYRLLFPGGRVKYIRALAHPVETPGGDFEYVGALMDVTAAKQAEDQLHEAHTSLAHVTRVTTLGELVASIAHEVNQPLAGIVTNGEACLRWLGRDEPDLKETRSAVRRMIADGQRAGEIIRRLRALTRKDGLQLMPLSLNSVVKEAIPLVQRELINNHVSLRLDLASGLPVVMGDKIQIQQVIINLMLNAVQAMSSISGRPRNLCIRSECDEDGGVRLTVRDSGIGIAPENLDRLFKPFFTTKDGGMGMGLSICRSIIEAHGGLMWAANNADFGASFGFILKREKEAE
jgi:signal transduction histidine kinase